MEIYNRGIKLLRFMEKRWDFKFESLDQMDELLHIGFVKDGREVPPELTQEDVDDALDNHKGARSAHIADLILRWARKKDEEGEIHIDFNNCVRRYCRFTTDVLSAFLPNTAEPYSAWDTPNHYFYEIVNNAGHWIKMQLAFSGENMPVEQREICDKVQQSFPSIHFQNNNPWVWRVPYKTKKVMIPEDMSDEQILEILDKQYDEMMSFQDELVQVVKEGESESLELDMPTGNVQEA